jgi:hypothetical protein
MIADELEMSALGEDGRFVAKRSVFEMEHETTRDSIVTRDLQQFAVSQDRSGGISKHEKAMDQTFCVTHRDLLPNKHAGP